MAASPAEQSSFPDHGHRWVMVIAILGGLQIGLLLLDISPVLPVIRHEFGVDHVAAGWAISATIISHTCSLAVAGMVEDRLGPRPLFIAGFSFMLGSVVLRAVAPTFWLLVLSRVITGFGTACIGIGSISAITLYSSAVTRIRDQGIFGGMQQFGIMVVQLTAPVSVVALGRQTYWLVLAAGIAITLILCLVYFPRGKPGTMFEATGHMREVVTDRYGWILSIANMAGYGAFVGVTAWSASFLIERYGVTGAQTGWLTAGALAFGVLGRMTCGTIVGWMGTQRLIRSFVSLTALAIFLMPLAPVAGIAALFLLVFAWSSSVPFGAIFGSVPLRPAPGGMGRRIMLITISGNVLGLTLPPLIGYSIHVTGSFTPGFWLAGIFIGAAALVLMRTSLDAQPGTVIEVAHSQ
jgi:nitrate/nitrite transporter NarK